MCGEGEGEGKKEGEGRREGEVEGDGGECGGLGWVGAFGKRWAASINHECVRDRRWRESRLIFSGTWGRFVNFSLYFILFNSISGIVLSSISWVFSLCINLFSAVLKT